MKQHQEVGTSREPGSVEDLKVRLQTSYSAENHESLNNELAALMIRLSWLPDPIEPSGSGA